MAIIKVNHKNLVSTAKKVDEYVKNIDKNMKSMDTTMGLVGLVWSGKDYEQVKKKWDSINSDNSTTGYMRTELKVYAGKIREASKLYKKQQAKAIANAKYFCK